MSGEIADWARPNFVPGRGDALLFYVVYGDVGNKVAISRSRYRCEGVPAGLEIGGYSPATHPEVVASFREGYTWKTLESESPDFAREIAAQTHCMLFRGDFKDPPSLNYIRDVVGLVTHALDNGGVAVYDLQMLRWWTPSHWREKIFEPAGPVPRHHVVILVSEDEGGSEWIHTRGMRKFGRPDLSIHGVPSEGREVMVDLFDRFIEHQAFGAVIPEGQEIRMESLPAGLRCFHRGSLDDPDFNNVHVEIEWPEGL